MAGIHSFTSLLAWTLLATSLASAQQVNPWGQCGGQGYTGITACTAGHTCTFLGQFYSQCQPTPQAPPPAQPGAVRTVTVTATVTVDAECPTATAAPAGLNELAKKAGLLYFGSATDNGSLRDAPYVEILSNVNEFGQITPANSMKWESTEPQRGVFSFAGADQIVSFAQKNGQIMRGHTCVWHSQLASWVEAGKFDAPTLESIVVNHCSTVVGQYKGQIYSWDVVNEMFNEDGTFRESVFYNTLGEGYIATALRTARAADPNAKLYLNDYNVEGVNAKSMGMINLVKKLKEDGVPIDGIGLQAHLIAGSVPTDIQANIEAMTALGVEVAITELDIRMTLPVSEEKLQQQQRDYQNVITACLNVDGCIGVTIWDFTDKYSWVPGVFTGEGAALPWDDNLERKPAYDGIAAAFSS